MVPAAMVSLMESACLLIAVLYPILCIVYRFNPAKDMNKKKSFNRSLPILLLFLAVKLSFDQQNMEPNLYSVLLVGRHSSPFEIRHAYKAQSLAHHPDKTPLGSDRTEFYVIKAAYDGDFTNCTLFALWAQNVLVLMDENKRDVYNRFGFDSLDFDPRLDEMMQFVDMLTVYLFWSIVVYIFTIPQSSRSSRSWCAILGVVMLFVQAMFTLLDATLPVFLKSTMLASVTEYEVILFMHSIFPVLVMGLICLAEGFYFDLNHYTLMFLEKFVSRNKELYGLLEHMRLLANKSTADQIVAEENSKKMEADLQVIIAKLTAEDREIAEVLKTFKAAGAVNNREIFLK